MALPTIHYQQIVAGTGSSTHASVFPALCALLADAGWTQEFIDSDAIGGGSAGDPAWDKSPSGSTVCGRAVYSMPANDHSRIWYVEIAPRWQGDDTELVWWFRVGIGIDEGDDLISPGDALAVTVDGSGTTSNEVLLSVSEDGFALISSAAANNQSKQFILERARDTDGAVLDDLWVYGRSEETGAGETWPDSTSQLNTYGMNVAYRASDGMQYTSRPAAWVLGGSTTGGDGETNIPAGPIPNVPQVRGYPRHALAVRSGDAVVNSDHPVLVDGMVRMYRTNTVNPNTASTDSPPDNISWLVAKE